MPNWCMNKLNISGPEKDIHLFKTKANGPVQSYNNYMPRNGGEWPIHDDVRLKALSESLPEPGESSVLSFHALYPVPDDVRRFPYDDTRAKEVGERVGCVRAYGGYNWESQHWGCKWGASEPDLQHEEDTFLSYSFDTPWAPPFSFLEKVSGDWPTLSFEVEYEEPGMGFAGKSVFCNGEVIFEDEWEPEYEEEEDCDE
jgi:hypothetical protein